MADPDVRVERLLPMRVAWVRAVGRSPEQDVDTQPPAGVGVKDFPGGVYAVTSCRVTGSPSVLETRRALLRRGHCIEHCWRRTAHELERIRSPLADEHEIELDLYLPLEEQEVA